MSNTDPNVQCEFTDHGTTFRIEASSMFADAWLLTRETKGKKEVITHFARGTPPTLRIVGKEAE